MLAGACAGRESPRWVRSRTQLAVRGTSRQTSLFPASWRGSKNGCSGSTPLAKQTFVDVQSFLPQIETDTDIDPLRSRADFLKLLAEQRAQSERVRTNPDRQVMS